MTQEEEILKLFADNGGQFETKDIPYNLAFEFRRAISDLRDKGYNIPPAERITKNNFRYYLISIPQAINFDDTGQGAFL